MRNVLDLRPDAEIEIDYSCAKEKQIAIFAVVFGIALVIGVWYLMWLDSGCATNGIMTVAGKVCM